MPNEREAEAMKRPAEAGQKASLSDYLAAERTLLAWIRTGLAMMGFGFVVARFGLFLEQIQVIEGLTFRAAHRIVALVWHIADRSRGFGERFCGMASCSIGAATGSRRRVERSSSDPGGFGRFLSGIGRAGNGDLSLFDSDYKPLGQFT